MNETSESFELLSILLVSHGDSGSHLLFKYPFFDSSNINTSILLKPSKKINFPKKKFLK
jgi:hypothetical protein